MLSDEKYKAALNAFTARLLAGPFRDRIMKIILFGSHAKGAARPESDLDILIVTNNGDELSDFIADLALEIQMEYRVGLEPVTVGLDELFPVCSYFLANVMRYGQEVYAVPHETLKEEERKNLLKLAEEYLAGAEQAAENGYWRLAVDAAYNAAELAVKSLVLKLDDDLPGSHGGLVGRFGELYIKTGIYEKALGRQLNHALERRNQARYRYQAVIKRDDAQAVIELARTLKELAERELLTPGNPRRTP